MERFFCFFFLCVPFAISLPAPISNPPPKRYKVWGGKCVLCPENSIRLLNYTDKNGVGDEDGICVLLLGPEPASLRPWTLLKLVAQVTSRQQ